MWIWESGLRGIGRNNVIIFVNEIALSIVALLGFIREFRENVM